MVEPANHEDDMDALVACLGDDASQIRNELENGRPNCVGFICEEWADSMEKAAATIASLCKQVDESRGQLGVAVALLQECLGPLEVSAAIIEDEDGGEAMETLIQRVRKFCVDAASMNLNSTHGVNACAKGGAE